MGHHNIEKHKMGQWEIREKRELSMDIKQWMSCIHNDNAFEQ